VLDKLEANTGTQLGSSSCGNGKKTHELGEVRLCKTIGFIVESAEQISKTMNTDSGMNGKARCQKYAK
jgi:hypothetical protein